MYWSGRSEDHAARLAIDAAGLEDVAGREVRAEDLVVDQPESALARQRACGSSSRAISRWPAGGRRRRRSGRPATAAAREIAQTLRRVVGEQVQPPGGVGERVLVAQGSVAAAWFPGKPPPVDALIIGSIDEPAG